MNEPILEFFDHIPSKEEKIEMRKTSKPPSEWLRLLCRDWAIENEAMVQATDLKFLGYKSYLKGRLSSQLLCRLSIPDKTNENETPPAPIVSRNLDFWTVLGIQDDFDRSYIISQIEKFCAHYSIRAICIDDDLMVDHPPHDTSGPGATLAIPITSISHVEVPSNFMNTAMVTKDPRYFPPPPTTTTPTREVKHRQRTRSSLRKQNADRAAKEATREEKRQNKLKVRQNREQLIRQQKEAALARAAELVRSNRVPIEITRGAAAAQAAANAAVAMMGVKADDESSSKSKKSRSDIVVSTALDLDRIVTHAKNLWTKYNAIAKQHNQKVNWSTVAKELGIHVKVREKYARMHSRAIQRGFDFKACGHYKIKEHPQMFLEPISLKQKTKINTPPQKHEPHQLEVPVFNKDQPLDHHHHISDDQVAAAVDAAIKTVPAPDVTCYNDAAATVDTVMNTTNNTEVGLSVADAAQAAHAAQAALATNNTEVCLSVADAAQAALATNNTEVGLSLADATQPALVTNHAEVGLSVADAAQAALAAAPEHVANRQVPI